MESAMQNARVFLTLLDESLGTGKLNAQLTDQGTPAFSRISSCASERFESEKTAVETESE